MDKLSMHEVQDLADDFLQESQLREVNVVHSDGHCIPVVHLLTDFYKHIKKKKIGTEYDKMLRQSAELIVKEQSGTISLIERRLLIGGYSRAKRIMYQLESLGVVGPFEGSKMREVKVKNLEELNKILT